MYFGGRHTSRIPSMQNWSVCTCACPPTRSTPSHPGWRVSAGFSPELGGHYTELAGVDVAMTVLEFARSEGAGQLVLGATRRSRKDELLHGSVINKAIHSAGPIEVHVIPARNPVQSAVRTKPIGRSSPRHVVFPAERRTAAWVAAVLLPVAVTTGLLPVRSSLQLAGVLLCNLLAVVGVALLGGSRPAMLATGVAFVMSDFFFAPPFYSLRVGRRGGPDRVDHVRRGCGSRRLPRRSAGPPGCAHRSYECHLGEPPPFGRRQPHPFREGRQFDRLHPADIWSR